MFERVLITGGAGFIGSHVADELIAHGHSVRVLDNLSPQQHGPNATRPAYLDPRAELVVGDVRDEAAITRALAGVDAVLHLAAAVGVGQSMYELREYVDVNTVGTAVLLEGIAKRPVQKLVVASSMSIYGEGSYESTDGRRVDDVERDLARVRDGRWEPIDANGVTLLPIATTEDKPPHVASIYALSKYDQERMVLLFGKSYGIPAVALRLFNTYGPRQALSNPYTGVVAIFAARLLNGRRPVVFEDGKQLRDFVHVHDVARAFRLALTRSSADFRALNVASGRAISIADVAIRLAATLGRAELQPELNAHYRAGDVRHCFADIRRSRTLLGFEPTVELEPGLADVGAWLGRTPATDRTEVAQRELAARGLVF
jgi:dTDP-L-rhamnose 4-epimerase